MKRYTVKQISKRLAKAEGFAHHKDYPMSLAWTCVHDLLEHYDELGEQLREAWSENERA